MSTPTIAIIGAGPVGLFSAFTCGMLGYRCIIFDRLGHLGGQCTLYPDKPIYDIPGFPMVYAGDLINNLKKQIEPFEPIYKLGRLVSHCEATDEGFDLKDDQGETCTVKAVIIAAGIGAFTPKKPPLPKIESYEDQSIFYHVADKTIFKDKKVAIAGGGDTAVDWIIELSGIAESVHVIHRRDQFRCHPASLEKMKELARDNVIEMHVPYQLDDLEGDTQLKRIKLRHLKEDLHKFIECDYLLPFFGLSADLGPLRDWNLGIESNVIPVDPANMMTSVPGVFAIGDVATYENKLKLIMNGFGEASMCAYGIRRYLNPGQVFRFQYSTVSGVKALG